MSNDLKYMKLYDRYEKIKDERNKLRNVNNKLQEENIILKRQIVIATKQLMHCPYDPKDCSIIGEGSCETCSGLKETMKIDFEEAKVIIEGK